MSDKTITQLLSVTPLSGTEELPIWQAGTTKKVTAQAIADLASGGPGAVSSVNGYTGTVVLAKSDIGLGNVDNTSDVNKPISSATQSALDLKANISSLGAAAFTNDFNDLDNIPPALDPARVGRAIHVSVDGSDAVGDGSLNAPYATVEFALTQVPNGLNINTSYVIMLGAGTHTTPTCKLKPYVALVGLGYITTRLNVTSGIVELETSGAPYSSNSRNQIHNLQLSGSTGITMNFTGFSNASNVLDVTNCWINGAVNYIGRAFGADYIQFYRSFIFGAFNVTNGQGECEACALLGGFNHTTSSASAGSFGFAIHSTRMGGATTIISDNSRTLGLQVTATDLTNLSATGAGITVTMDAVSFPDHNEITLSGGAVIAKDKAFARHTAIPLTASSFGLEGDFSVDANYRYDCIATNTWVRVPVSTF